MTEKLYYTIGEVSEMFSVNASLIRFWEKEFPLIKPQKNSKGNRVFTQKDIDNLRLIYHLLKERGFTIQGAREQIAGFKKEEERKTEIIKSLENIKTLLKDLGEEM